MQKNLPARNIERMGSNVAKYLQFYDNLLIRGECFGAIFSVKTGIG